MKRPNLSHATRVARIELRRSVRAIRSSNTRTVAFGVALLFWVALPTVGGGFLAYELGTALPDVATPFPILDLVRGGSAVGWVGLAALAAARSAGGKAEIDASDGILTTIPARDVALGLLLAEYARMALVAAIPVLTIAAGLAVGAGVVVPLLAVPATAALVIAVALSIGFPVGVGVKWVTIRSPWLAQNKTAILLVAFGLYFLGVTSQAFNDAIAVLQRALRDTPLAWFGDAVLLGLPGIEAVPSYALGAAALVAVLVPSLGTVGIRAATTLWYADRAQVEETEQEGREAREGDGRESESRGLSAFVSRKRKTSVAESVLSRFVSRPTRTVTLAAWRRTKRAPIRLLYVAYPLFFLYVPLRTAFESGVPTSLPVLVALYGTWAVGAMVLNPLGDEGAVLPTTLLSGIDGRQFVAGHVLSAALVGVPVVALATAAAGVLSPLAPLRWVTLTAVSAALVVVGTVLAVGVGTLFPRFGAVEVFRSREVVVPSKAAFAIYSLALLGGAVGAVVASVPVFANLLAGLLGVSSAVARWLGVVVAVLVGVVGPVVAYRFATREFDEYSLD